MTQKLTNNMLTSLASSKLTGTLPALDGSSLTGFSATTKSANNPTVSTAPSNGLGTVWTNTVTGDVFICTNNAVGDYVWKNIGSGSGDILLTASYSGKTYGYSASGYSQALSPYSNVNDYQKYPFATQSDAAYVGEMDTNLARYGASGSSSATYGYIACGQEYTNTAYNNSRVDKFSFVTDSNSLHAHDLGQAEYASAGFSSINTGYGYHTGGYISSPQTFITHIKKYSFSGDWDSASVGNMSNARFSHGGYNSETHGFTSGGEGSSVPGYNSIDKFSFANEGTATDHGDLTIMRQWSSSSSSLTHGFMCGGSNNAIAYNKAEEIETFLFSSNTTAALHGELMWKSWQCASGSSSVAYGYHNGGNDDYNSSSIHKYSYASNTVATDQGDLTRRTANATGHQV